MKFIADLHVHSHFSRATAKNLDIEHLYIAAQLKGIMVVATGDFTHPGWQAEIREKLVPAESGLFKLKDSIARICDQEVPFSCRRPVRFMLQAEISNIYKKDGKTRKNHNLIYVPDMETAARFSAELDLIGNIKSDGRPILGLDARHMLEILLEISDRSFLIPAHIWTPWFSVLGSKSGFDSIEACFEDLTPHIFAYETGLSSDPAMNGRVSALDHLTAISNSDAHSPMNLGREANLFNTDLSYEDIKNALKTGNKEHFGGTFEFYPEEGKYHLDGHRKCDVCFTPSQSIAASGVCPVCQKPLTLGVLYRVNELADRREEESSAQIHPYYSLIPLVEILSEILKVGPKSKKVQQNYHVLLEKLGPEFDILHNLGLEKIDQAHLPLLAEAIKRMRLKQVNIIPGYDGEYGKILVFKQEELEVLNKQRKLFDFNDNRQISKHKQDKKLPCSQQAASRKVSPATRQKLPDQSTVSNQQKISFSEGDDVRHQESVVPGDQPFRLKALNLEQRQAVLHRGGPLMIVAGPGTGKTRTLTHKIAYLIQNIHIAPDQILALTFTQKAAREMHDRLGELLSNQQSSSLPFAGTFHSFCLTLLKEHHQKKNEMKKGEGQTNPQESDCRIIDDIDRLFLISRAIKNVEQQGLKIDINQNKISDLIALAKQNLLHHHDDLASLMSGFSDRQSAIRQLSEVYQAYQKLQDIFNVYDYEDLIFNVVALLEDNPTIHERYCDQYRYIFIDEYQDINYGQYRIIRRLAPEDANLCVIGDPDQAIYGFRGSDVAYFKRFLVDYPTAETITLRRNYRSTETILKASHQVICRHAISMDSISPQDSTDMVENMPRTYSGINGIEKIVFMKTATEKSEAVAIGKSIEQLMGGLEFHAADFGKIEARSDLKAYGFSDFAILYRTRAQAQIIAEVFKKAGIPFQVASRNRILDKPGITELLSLLKIIEDQATYIDVKRISDLFSRQNKMNDMLIDICFNENKNLFEALEQLLPVLPLKRLNKSFKLFMAFVESLKPMKAAIKDMTVGEKLSRLYETLETAPLFKNDREIRDILNYLVLIAADAETVGDFISDIALKNDIDVYHPEAQKVTLMTMHASKGLEFPVVFIAGCEKGFLPLERPGGNFLDVDEERRLFYVAMTRAKDLLYLMHASHRMIFGANVSREPSPFIDDIESCLKEAQTVEFNQAQKKRGISKKQLELF